MKCPYCLQPIAVLSREHIFPRFLGGRRCIEVCKECNETLGHTIEGAASKQLDRLHLSIASWGVSLVNRAPVWRAAYTAEGKTYDLTVGERGVQPRLSKPVVKHDLEGEIETAEFATRAEAEHAAQRLVDRGKAKAVEVREAPPPRITLEGLGNTLILDPQMRRVALKMCIALATVLPGSDPSHVEAAQRILRSDPASVPQIVLAAYSEYRELERHRPALSHVVFVERGRDRIYGIVQFFGVIQLFCNLMKGPSIVGEPAAVIGTLDPVVGSEAFLELEPLGLAEPPFWLNVADLPGLVGGWMRKFRDQAIQRGATHPPDLRITSLEVTPNLARSTETEGTKQDGE